MSSGNGRSETEFLPENWETPSIRSVCTLINGRGFKPFEWESSGLPIIRIQNLNGSDDFNYYKGSYDKKIEVHPGQLLFAWSGSRGTSFGPHLWHGPVGLLNYHTWKVEVDESKLNGKFFLHALRQLTEFIEGRAHGASALVHTQKWEMEGFHFPMPKEKEEQRAIATALSDVDALIAGLERLIAKKRDIKQAAMQQLLTGQTRLPGFSGEWLHRPLGDLGSTYGGLVGKSKADFGHGSASYVPFVNVMANVRIDCSAFEPVDVATSENQNRVLAGDLLFNGSSETPEEVALCSLMTAAVDDLYLNSFCFGFRLKQGAEASGLFLAYLMRSHIGRELMKSLAQGSTRYNLSKAALLQAQLELPALDEQTAIATVLSDMDADLSALESRLAKTRVLKQGMMQELLTGRTRLV